MSHVIFISKSLASSTLRYLHGDLPYNQCSILTTPTFNKVYFLKQEISLRVLRRNYY